MRSGARIAVIFGRHQMGYLLLIGFIFATIAVIVLGRQKMTRDEFFRHLQYLERPFEIQPAPQGIINNKFTLSNFDGTM
jgi:hypothetical protein